ncbi:MAG: hypothetical protein IH944_07160 [Armatimonadetes bacterium]|nr:hypothetical protein [Armatimonadota bacterium]
MALTYTQAWPIFAFAWLARSEEQLLKRIPLYSQENKDFARALFFMKRSDWLSAQTAIDRVPRGAPGPIEDYRLAIENHEERFGH